MKSKSILFLALAAVVLGSCASSPDGTPRMPASFSENMETATIVTNERRASQCISPVRINRINDQQFASGMQRFDLPPGTATISGQAIISGDFCRNSSVASRGGDAITPLTYGFEAGKVYWVGVNHTASRPTGWFLDVWFVADKVPADEESAD